jgi:DNA-binding NarL/FixJ family response regulator
MESSPCLTERERLVVQLLAEGKTQKQIAQSIERTPQRLRQILWIVRQKMDAETTTAAVVRADRMGLLETGEITIEHGGDQ